jgi:hypothetical protein
MTDPVFQVDAVDWSDIGYQLAHGILKQATEARVDKGVISAAAEASGATMAVGMKVGEDLALGAGKLLHVLEELMLPFIAAFTVPIVSGLFGAEVNEAEFTHKLQHGAGAPAAHAIVDGLMRAIAGDGGGGALAPGPEGATRIASAAVQAALESSFNALVPEIASGMLPFDFGKFSAIAELPETIISALGVSRLVRRGLSPLIDATCATPMKWHVNKLYRPELLSAALAVRQFTRGKWTREQLDEELARQGWSADRVDALIHDGTQRLSDGTIKSLRALNALDDAVAKERLRENGWTAQDADVLTKAWALERLYEYGDRELSAIASARIAGEITDTEARDRAGSLLPNDDLRDSFLSYANRSRELSRRHMTHGEIRECVERGIATRADYRRWLDRENYPPDEALMLELLLESTLRGQQEAAKQKERLEAERAAEKKAAADAKAKREAEIAAKKTNVAASLSDLERAVVLGIVPIGVYEARLVTEQFAAADRSFMVDLLQHQREEYLAAQEKKADQAAALARKSISLSTLERAVLAGVTSLDEYRRRLESEGLDAGDVAVMVQLLSDELRDRAAAAAKRAEAQAAAAVRGLSLTQVEKAVRQGLRTPDSYRAWLIDQGFSPEDAALLVDSLARDMADAEAAAARREQINSTPAARGASLAQLERAVKLGVRTIDDYANKLIEIKVPTDDQVTLLGLLRAELAQLDAAREKRDAPAPAPEPPGLTRADLERGVRAGVISLTQYRAELQVRGYSSDDADLLAQLALLELQDTQQSRQRRDQVDADNPQRALARADMERAVKKGIRTLDDYAAFVAAANYSTDDQALLVQLLTVEADATKTAATRRAKLATELAAAGVDLDALDAAAIAGALPIDDYLSQLGAANVAPADLGLLVQLIIEQQTSGG